MNVYTFTGRLARDCETRFTQGGMAICSFTVAVDYGFGDRKGTNWIRCSLFGKRAEGRLPQYLLKGTQVAVSGELRVQEYTDKDGNARTSVDCNADSLDLIGSRQDASAPASNQGGNYGGGASSNSFPSHGGGGNSAPVPRSNAAPAKTANDPFASSPDFGSVPVDDDIPF
ncbi:MAG: single-stranded DNA-binding protein [Mariprofundus sp.]|nr:single-stranded DNA-binding protein [Mariprofundus sp.]